MKPFINKIKNGVDTIHEENEDSGLYLFQLVQTGEDILVTAKACSDLVPALSEFQGHCIPIFLIMASGSLVDYVHGADGKRIREVRATCHIV